MIYDKVERNEPVRQGDIYKNIPRFDFSMTKFALAHDEKVEVGNWRDFTARSSSDEPMTALVAVRPVSAIVISQDCDASREEYISLCVVKEFLGSIGQANAEPKNSRKWSSLIFKTEVQNPKVFYLPADRTIGFAKPQAAIFLDVLRVKLSDLGDACDSRVGRLNDVANEHFRERLGLFFRRYSYNQWYPLTKEQFDAYKDDCPEPVKPYKWQE